MSVTHYDCLVIGAGQAGGPLASALAESGRKTAIVEREHVGGTCINEGCTPTKTMVASARVAYLARRGADYGVQTGPVSVDLAKVRQRKRDIVNSWRDGGEKRLRQSEGLDVFMGEASFTGPKALHIQLNNGDALDVTADQIFINAGARPFVPSIPGLDSIPFLNSTTIMELDKIPEHLLILGGGYIGLEFGQMFRRFGSKVTIVQRGARLLGREDADVADEVTAIMRQDGIEILLNTEAVSVSQSSAGNVVLTVKTAEGERSLEGSHLLAAVGRVPNSDRLNLSSTGVKTDQRGFIPVNEHLETNVAGIYALGDVNGGPAFTHISYDDYRIIRENLIHHGTRTTKDRILPYTVFMDPQLGRVGLTEEDAKQQGLNIRVAKMPMSSVARADEMDEMRGMMKAIVDVDTKQILGCAILGIEGGEIMGALSIAMMGHVPYTTLADAVFAHPTLMESLNNLFTGLDN